VEVHHGNKFLANKEPVAFNFVAMNNQPILQNVLYLRTGEENIGPYHITQVKSMWNTGIITADTICWGEGWSQWMLVSTFLGLEEQTEISNQKSPVFKTPESTRTPTDVRSRSTDKLVVHASLKSSTVDQSEQPNIKQPIPDRSAVPESNPADLPASVHGAAAPELNATIHAHHYFGQFAFGLLRLLIMMIVIRFGWLLISTGMNSGKALVLAIIQAGLWFFVFALCAISIGGMRAYKSGQWPEWHFGVYVALLWLFLNGIYPTIF
jgi:hypothetical protein